MGPYRIVGKFLVDSSMGSHSTVGIISGQPVSPYKILGTYALVSSMGPCSIIGTFS